jgi:hypothetical protein
MLHQSTPIILTKCRFHGVLMSAARCSNRRDGGIFEQPYWPAAFARSFSFSFSSSDNILYQSWKLATFSRPH